MAATPYEAKVLTPRLTAEGTDALTDLMVAVNGFYYPGDRATAIYQAVAWLQTRPDLCRALSLGVESEVTA